jgi:hypothetical protein
MLTLTFNLIKKTVIYNINIESDKAFEINGIDLDF